MLWMMDAQWVMGGRPRGPSPGLHGGQSSHTKVLVAPARGPPGVGLPGGWPGELCLFLLLMQV